jgi:hypothetical protein
MLRYIGLTEHEAPCGIDPTSKPVKDILVNALTQSAWMFVLAHQGMPISDHEETVVLILQLLPILKDPHQMSKVELARWPHPT